MTTFGQTLRAYRLSRGLTQAVLAVKVGCSANDLVLWELHGRAPRLATLQAVAQVLALSDAELVELVRARVGP